MATCNAAKDIFVLVSIIHISKLEITTDLTNKIVELWPTELGVAPANGEELRQHIVKISQRLIDSVSPAASVAVNEDSGGASLSDAIVVKDTDDDFDVVIHRPMPCRFRVPPAASLVTPQSIKERYAIERSFQTAEYKSLPPAPRSLDRPAAATPQKTTKQFDRGKNSARCPSTAGKQGNGPATPVSLDKPAIGCKTRMTDLRVTSDKVLRMKSLRGDSACKSSKVTEETVIDDLESDKETSNTPTTITTTRKRRRGINYKWVP
ncbi:hypothetical protein AUEXF2481DRAFT_228741 [Aureobasidium subglaciale EXF-2481]|uniref:Uncharacterized protein n=1 Tax=Aureobasidium subglaciale (strain EXF-2481) TaxID=1043005 RepID=A0A074YAY4_AURSE|nr:uncharacterized protein AUEXF2481DRAFT_228741 [Aureobasidium subglaciale EXF-2481]KEQ94935.1 hypothetical protein AUEXF2481DRAFT_228741 [Aureobasidium subglaciale EXF-2481]